MENESDLTAKNVGIKPTGLYLRPELVRLLKVVAASEGCSASKVADRAIRMYVCDEVPKADIPERFHEIVELLRQKGDDF